MAKITNDKKLPLGVALEPSHVQGNLQDVAANFGGGIIADQRARPQAPFSVTWCYSMTVGALGSGSEEQLHFTLPPLQDDWNDDLVSTEETPPLTLDSISLGFDLMNQNLTLGSATGLPVAGVEASSVTLRLYKLTNDPPTTEAPPQKTQMAEVLIQAEDIAGQFNTKNPTILRDLGVAIDRFAIYQWEIESAAPIFSVLIRATFLHPVVQRDTAAVLGDALNAGVPVSAQNAPAAALYNRDYDAVVLPAPAANSLIQAGGVSGVQTQLETVDSVFRRKLVGGRSNRYQSDEAFATDRKEQLLEDSNYFCWCVNLLKTGGNYSPITGVTAANFEVTYPNAGGHAIWDRALIPISFPGTIHHVFLEAAGINEFIRRNPGPTIPLSSRGLEVGVGLYRGVRLPSPSYQQVAYLSTGLTGATGQLLNERLWQVPLVWTGAAGAVMGKGYIPQGRPVYFGRQLTYDGAVPREDIADIVASSAAEAVPATGGYEQFIEVRLTYVRGTGSTWVTGNALDRLLSNAGINVYIVGKLGLEE